MVEIMMFNSNTREQRYMDGSRHQEIAKLKSEGWLENPRMVQMYHPGLHKDMAVTTQERKEWEEKGYYADPAFIYHPKDGTKKVSLVDAQKAFKNGWYASPAQFPGNDIGAIKTPGVMKEAS